jgi:hypothetical protein
MGGFRSYNRGNILSAQFYAAAVKAHPDIPSEIAVGEFNTLHAWLQEHLRANGCESGHRVVAEISSSFGTPSIRASAAPSGGERRGRASLALAALRPPPLAASRLPAR